MRKIFLAGIFCFLCVAAVFGQAGYKNFVFGMSAEQVTKLAPDAKEFVGRGGSIPAPYAILMYVYNSEVGSLWNSKAAILKVNFGENWITYYSPKEQLVFTFINNKLIAVDVQGLAADVLADLKTRYGEKKIITFNDYDAWYIDTAVWNDGQRYIMYCMWYDYGSLKNDSTTVYYYDAGYLKPLMEKVMQQFRASRSSRLD